MSGAWGPAVLRWGWAGTRVPWGLLLEGRAGGGRVRVQKKAEVEGGLAGGKAGAALPPRMAPHPPLFLPKASASRSPAESAACVHLTSALRCVSRSPSTWVS